MNLLELFFDPHFRIGLSAQDFAILHVFRTLEYNALNTAEINDHLAAQLQREPRLKTIYRILIKLCDLALLEEAGSGLSESGIRRGGVGRPQKKYRVTASGLRALHLADELLAAHNQNIQVSD